MPSPKPVARAACKPEPEEVPTMKSLRKGVTLIEALMAIFVTAIGLLSLLVLFPVGAFRMAQAITDDRSAHAAANAFALMEALNIHNDTLITTLPSNAYT